MDTLVFPIFVVFILHRILIRGAVLWLRLLNGDKIQEVVVVIFDIDLVYQHDL